MDYKTRRKFEQRMWNLSQLEYRVNKINRKNKRSSTKRKKKKSYNSKILNSLLIQ